MSQIPSTIAQPWVGSELANLVGPDVGPEVGEKVGPDVGPDVGAEVGLLDGMLLLEGATLN